MFGQTTYAYIYLLSAWHKHQVKQYMRNASLFLVSTLVEMAIYFDILDSRLGYRDLRSYEIYSV